MLTAMVTGLLVSILDCASLTCENEQMTVNAPLILYSRADCHLCDLVAAMLETAGLHWSPVDIDSDPGLVRKYGIHVPVVTRPGDGRELFFPFDEEALLQFTASGLKT
jgi:hypothetical protein